MPQEKHKRKPKITLREKQIREHKTKSPLYKFMQKEASKRMGMRKVKGGAEIWYKRQPGKAERQAREAYEKGQEIRKRKHQGARIVRS